MKFFEANDFAGNTHEWENSKFIRVEYAVDICNAKLEREGKVVYSTHGAMFSITHKASNDGLKALLINIESLEACKHPKEKVFKKKFLSIGPASEGKTPGEYYKCECGARVEPSGFEVVG